MMLVIDRFENDIAVLEDDNGEAVNVPVALLPKGACEGDCVVFDGESYTLDKEETSKRSDNMRSRLHALLGRSPRKDNNNA